MEVKENDRHMHHLSGGRESNLPGPQGVDVAGQGAHWPLASVLTLISATAFAAHAHRNQRRKDAERSPYINHPITLMDVLANEAGIADPTVLAAAVLHDTIEDTEVTFDELKTAFGEKIASIVLEVTDDKSLPKHERKIRQIEHAATISPEAKMVKWADLICNLRDLIHTRPLDWPLDRRRDYFDWARKVVDRMRGVCARLEALFDQEMARRT
jgi:GTP diphosphokinase / guanosine-3',5'-bis(diphosphate) 3'-diphosphatase